MGNLPNARNTSYTPASPVKSGDLDDIQDCIVAAKHAAMEFDIHAAWLRPVSGNPTFLGSSWTANAAAAYSLYAPLHVPVGDRIVTYFAGYDRPNVGTVSIQLIHQPLIGGAVVVVDTFNDTTTNGLIVTTRTVNHTVVAAHAYAIIISLDGTAAAAGGNLVIGAGTTRDKL